METSSSDPFSLRSASAVPVGAQVTPGGVTYRVWAPDHPTVQVRINPGTTANRALVLRPLGEGYHGIEDEGGRPGDRYFYRVGTTDLPDPAARFQPEGVEGPSEVIDPGTFRWHEAGWRKPPLRGRVIYELHVGTFTPAGTFRSAIERLDDLVDLGINTIQLMPVGDFAGRRNWGYDGVMLFAPARCYGRPDDLRALVEAAHRRQLAVVLDVVYNHLGPAGNVLPKYSRQYLHPQRESFWGQGLNFDGPQSAAVRQFFVQNALHWLDDYRFDGLRLDAVHAIVDESRPHLVAEITAGAHARGAFVIAEDDRNDAAIVSPAPAGGWGVDGVWADDLHHTLRVALTGQKEAHFQNYRGSLEEWVETLHHGWLYRGQHFATWQRPRGSDPLRLSPEQFVICISNHDQVGNRPKGDRLHERIDPGQYRAVSLLLCLAPYTPMLFMGQEWGATTPFPFFTDLPGELGEKIAENRRGEFAKCGANYPEDVLASMPDPQAEATFRSAKLNWAESGEPPHAPLRKLYREALRLRSREPVFPSPPRSAWSVAPAGGKILALRWSQPEGDWLLLVSVEATEWRPAEGAVGGARPGGRWQPLLSTHEKRFGGTETLETIPLARPGLRGPGAVLFRELTA